MKTKDSGKGRGPEWGVKGTKKDKWGQIWAKNSDKRLQRHIKKSTLGLLT